MSRRWLVAAALVLAAVALFALVAGGFLWPRPQFRRGPWSAPPAAEEPADRELAPPPAAP